MAAAVAIVALASFHGGRAVVAVADAAHVARVRGTELVVDRGDVGVRDVPKAFDLAAGHPFGDPHYAGEVAWYPFATPLLATIAQRVTALPMNEAYLVTGAVLSGVALLALGALTWAWAGAAGLVAVLVALLAGVGWPSTGVYPYQTATLPLTLYLAAATVALDRVGSASARRVPAAMAMAGGLHGAALALRRVPPGQALARAAAYAIPLLGALGALFLPQVVFYGGLRQSDAARFYLEPTFADGWSP